MADHHRFNLKTLEDLRILADSLSLDIPISEDVSPLLEPAEIGGKRVANRLTVQPMEGFDSTGEGSPGELTFRRYKRYAEGGSGMIWFEATSVMQEGRSNPRQLLLDQNNLDDFKYLVEETRTAAIKTFGSGHNPFLVMQLTHSGRFSKPDGKITGKYFSENPHLDPNGNCVSLISDKELELIRDKYFNAIQLAEEAGFDSVDIKISHGYLLHEILAAFDKKDSRFGGSYENRMSLIRELVSFPTDLLRSIRLNASDLIPYPYGFGMSMDGSMEVDLSEPKTFIRELGAQVPLWNITAGVPYYNPFVNRPYDKGLKGSATPPEHPLEGVARMIRLTEDLQKEFPELPMVGSAYSWLRQFFPYVGAGVLKQAKASFIGVGRSAFAYPDAPKDLMEKGELDPKKVCVTCTNCTQLMRNSQPSGCTTRDRHFYSLSK